MNIYSTTSTTSPQPTLTAAGLLKQMEDLMSQVEPDPIGEWMREQGFPPESSMLVLPERMRAELGPFPPRYVQFSPAVAHPVLSRDPFAMLRTSAEAWAVSLRGLNDAAFGAAQAMRDFLSLERRVLRLQRAVPRGKAARKASFAARAKARRLGERR